MSSATGGNAETVLPTAGSHDLMGRARAARAAREAPEKVRSEIAAIVDRPTMEESDQSVEQVECKVEIKVMVPVASDDAPLATLASIVLGTVEESGIEIREIKVSRK